MRKMSKVLALILSIAMMFSLVTISGFAAEGGTMSFSSPAAVLAGSTVVVNFNLDTNPGVTFMSAEFSYDKNALELKTVEDLGSIGTYVGFDGVDNVADMLTWQNATSRNNFTATGTVAKLTFEVKTTATVGSYDITLSPVALDILNADGEEVPFTATKGTITVIEETNLATAKATPDTVSVDYGADADAINTALAAVNATGDGQTTGGTAVTDMALTITGWDGVDAIDTKNMTATQTVTGNIKTDVDGVNFAEAAKTVTVTVTIIPLSAAVVVDPSTVSIKKGAACTEADIKAAIMAATNGKIELKKDANGEVLDTVTFTEADITVTGTLDSTDTASTASAVIATTNAVASDNGVFHLTNGFTTGSFTIGVKKSSGNHSVSGIPSNGGNTTTKEYNITTGKTENGSISVQAKAASGAEVKVTATPDKGYKLDKITVSRESGVPITVTGDTFTMPAGNVIVSATFVEGEAGDNPPVVEPPVETFFTDVPESYWGYEFIKELKEMGVVNGVTETTFAPENNVTRAEFAKMVAGAFKLTATTTETAFTDCGADDWYTPYVIAATEAGYIKGIEEDFYGADQNITRQDICTILGRIAGGEATAALAFSDAADVAEYAADYVALMAELGVVNGYEDNSFQPNANATRAEVSKMLVVMLKAMAPEEGGDQNIDENVEAGDDQNIDENADENGEENVDENGGENAEENVDEGGEENVEDAPEDNTEAE